MKNKLIHAAILLLWSCCSGYAQDTSSGTSGLTGKYRLISSSNAAESDSSLYIPNHLSIKRINDTVIGYKFSEDSLKWTFVDARDSVIVLQGKEQPAPVSGITKNGWKGRYVAVLKFGSGGNTLRGRFVNAANESTLVSYQFTTLCCSNHKQQQHCVNTLQEEQDCSKKFGCTGFKSME